MGLLGLLTLLTFQPQPLAGMLRGSAVEENVAGTVAGTAETRPAILPCNAALDSPAVIASTSGRAKYICTPLDSVTSSCIQRQTFTVRNRRGVRWRGGIKGGGVVVSGISR